MKPPKLGAVWTCKAKIGYAYYDKENRKDKIKTIEVVTDCPNPIKAAVERVKALYPNEEIYSVGEVSGQHGWSL